MKNAIVLGLVALALVACGKKEEVAVEAAPVVEAAPAPEAAPAVEASAPASDPAPVLEATPSEAVK